MKGLRVTKVVKEIKFEGVSGVSRHNQLQNQGFLRQSVTHFTWDFIEYGRVTQDLYESGLFALNNRVLIHCNYIAK